jgi:hypothetical protein
MAMSSLKSYSWASCRKGGPSPLPMQHKPLPQLLYLSSIWYRGIAVLLPGWVTSRIGLVTQHSDRSVNLGQHRHAVYDADSLQHYKTAKKCCGKHSNTAPVRRLQYVKAFSSNSMQ